MLDVLVIGAGPAGSHAAAGLAMRGHSVAVVEKNAGAGQGVCCTGIIGQPCMSLLNVPSELVYFRSRSASLFTPGGRRLRVERPEIVAFTVDRPGLDQLLAQRAMALGATYHFNQRVTEVDIRADRVRVHVAGAAEPHEARAVIVATGYGSRLPSALGFGKCADCLVAAQIPVDAPGLKEIEVYADQDIARGGFAWLVPTAPGKGWVGLLGRRQQSQALSAFLRRLTHLGRISEPTGEACFGAVPIQPLEKTAGDRVLILGEAAGQIKPTTGGGIFYGALCADIAADVLHGCLGADTLGEAALGAYHSRWQAQLSGELSVGYTAHSLWARARNDDVELLARIGARMGVSEVIRRSRRFSFDWHAPLLMQLVDLFPIPAGRFVPPAGSAHR